MRDLFLSLYVLFYRISRWRSFRRVTSAVFGTSVTQIVFAITALLWAEILIGQRFNPGVLGIGAGSLALYFLNYHVLVTQKLGPEFEGQFSGFSKGKRIRLRTTAIAIVVATWVFFFLTVSIYQRVFGITPAG